MVKTRKTKSAGGVVMNRKSGKILVVSQHGTSWSLPKGHIDEGEEAEEAARREVFEEAGLGDLDMIKSFPAYERFKMDKNNSDDKLELKEIQMFLFETGEENLSPRDPDNPEAKWVEKDKVEKILTHPKDKEFFRSIKKEL